MSLVKQSHELPCPDEALPLTHQEKHPTTNISNISTINAPWKVETKWIIWSKPYRNDVARAKAKSDLLKASVIQRAYLPSTIRGSLDLLYTVQAKPIEATLPKLYRLLTDGTIASQEPDGKEVVASMRRAILKNGLVEWSETCYCNPPLQHERATVYDKFFTDMRIQPATGSAGPDKGSFWSSLASETLRTAVPEESTFSGSMIRVLGRNTV